MDLKNETLADLQSKHHTKRFDAGMYNIRKLRKQWEKEQTRVISPKFMFGVIVGALVTYLLLRFV